MFANKSALRLNKYLNQKVVVDHQAEDDRDFCIFDCKEKQFALVD